MSEEQAIMSLEDAPREVAVAEAITDAQRTVLTQKTPKNVIKVRPGKGGKHFSYVEHAWVTATLNQAFNWAWSWDVLEWRTIPVDNPQPFEVFVLGRLTIHTPRGDIVKTQFGTASVKTSREGKVLSIGDDLKAASSDALKKCSSLLGVALDLYSSDLDDVYEGDNGKENFADDLSAAGIQAVSDEPFPSKLAAMAWGYDQGCFNSKDHAENTYLKLREDEQPTSAGEMAEMWRKDVFRRVEEAQVGA